MNLPVRARVFIAVVVAAGAASVAIRIPEITGWTWREVAACDGLVVATTLLQQFNISLRYRTETWNFLLVDSIWVAALLLVRPSVLTVAVVAGTLIGQGLKRWNAYKIAFNAGQFVAGITAAEVVFRALGHWAVTSPSAWMAAAVAMAAFFLVNAGSMALIISIVEEKRFLEVFVPPLGLNVVQWAGNVAIGILAGVLWVVQRAAIPMLVAPLALSYLAYRAWLDGMRERDRMAGLYEAARTLVQPISQTVDFGPFLRAVTAMLDATTAELVLIERDRVTIHDANGSATSLVTPLRSDGDGGREDGRPETYVRVHAGTAPSLSPVGGQAGELGVLVAYRPEPLSEAERSLLDTLASQVAVRLQNGRLYAETVEQRVQLEEILNHTSDGIFAVSPDGTIVSWNPAMERITLFPSSEAVGRPWEEIMGTPFLGSGIDRRGRRDPDRGRDVPVVRKDRVARWVRYTSNAIVDRDGAIKANVVLARDVTAELEAEELKADFVATVSHELRTPLTPLKGFVAALLHGTVDDSPEARQEYYRIMLNQANRLERLITDLLEAARIESGKPLVENRSVELISLLAEQVHEFSRQAPDRSIQLRSPASRILVRADPFRLTQVATNLIANALKYSPPTTPVVVSLERARGYAVVSVTDRGEGIPLPEQERIFERFHRLENGLTRQTGGTGLGLFIAKRLVEAMSGRLWVHSAPEEGSTFSFSLLLVEPSEATGDMAPVSAASA